MYFVQRVGGPNSTVFVHTTHKMVVTLRVFLFLLIYTHQFTHNKQFFISHFCLNTKFIYTRTNIHYLVLISVVGNKLCCCSFVPDCCCCFFCSSGGLFPMTSGSGLNIRLSSCPAVCTLQSFNKHSPTDYRFTRIQPYA